MKKETDLGVVLIVGGFVGIILSTSNKTEGIIKGKVLRRIVLIISILMMLLPGFITHF